MSQAARIIFSNVGPRGVTCEGLGMAYPPNNEISSSSRGQKWESQDRWVIFSDMRRVTSDNCRAISRMYVTTIEENMTEMLILSVRQFIFTSVLFFLASTPHRGSLCIAQLITF